MLAVLNKAGVTALMAAAEKGHVKVCVKLAELGAHLNVTDQVCDTCSDCIGVCCYAICCPHHRF